VRRGTAEAHEAGVERVDRVAALELRGVRSLEAWLERTEISSPALDEGEVAV
jgi:hypothetical protein